MRKDAVGAGSESTVEWMALEGFARGSAETPRVSPRAGTRDPSGSRHWQPEQLEPQTRKQ